MADIQPLMRTVRISYRRAEYDGAEGRGALENELRQALVGPLGRDFISRQLPFDDRGARAMLDDLELEPPGVFFSVQELDPRRALTFIPRPEQPQPRADRVTRAVPEQEDHVGATAYVLSIGNHLAIIESAGMRSTGLQAYLNNLLHAAGQRGPGELWVLWPKVQVVDAPWVREQGITSLEIKPQEARLQGAGPSMVDERRPQRRGAQPQLEDERFAHGDKVLDLLRILGASEADLNSWTARMSEDIGIEAKLILSVRKHKRKSEATLSEAAMGATVAALEESNQVSIKSPDGNRKGGLTTLKVSAQIAAGDDGLQTHDVAVALSRALQSWGARGAIDLVGG